MSEFFLINLICDGWFPYLADRAKHYGRVDLRVRHALVRLLDRV